ncbi:hypothetical protein ACQCX2_12435 [Propionibacteriaceae bacterium Y1700]|uniref:hypothetical protein n=1 Tax=Microlunatus sp. Y1700 TaxID=3418487 RepID=UPI003DA7348A
MNSEPRTDAPVEDREPWWTVYSIHDDEGTGIDFAYTVGLHDRGCPELHVWARPDRGDDPGVDWMFSDSDRVELLNSLAWRLIDGELAVGDQWQEEFDAGLAVVEFRLDPPGYREHLEAFQIHPEAEVLPLSWALTRLPEPPVVPLDAEARAEAVVELADVLADIRTDVRPGPPLPDGWHVPHLGEDVDPDLFDEKRWLGPRTPFVMARAAVLAAADSDDWLWLLHSLSETAQLDLTDSMINIIAMVARSVGRSAALMACNDAADALVDTLSSGEYAEQWSQFLARMAPDDQDGDGEEWQTLAGEQLAGALGDQLRLLFATEVVADQVPEAILLTVRGPWIAGLRRDGDVPGPEWVASDGTIDWVLSLFEPLSRDDLLALIAGDEEWRMSDDDYLALVSDLHSEALTGPFGCPQFPLRDLPALRGREDAGDIATELQPFASVLTAACEVGVDEAQCDLLVRAHGQVLPGLRTLPTPDAAGAAHRDR